MQKKLVFKSLLASLSALVMFMLVSPSLVSAATSTAGADDVPNLNLKKDFDGLDKKGDTVEAQGWKAWTVKQALRYGGSALSKLIKPLSKKNAALVKKYSKKAADAIDNLEKKTEGALRKAMEGVGIPKGAAKTLAKLIGGWIL